MQSMSLWVQFGRFKVKILHLLLIKVQSGGKHCEYLANLCVLTDYSYDSQSACSLYRQLSGGFGNSIYYDESRNEYLLNAAKIQILKEQVIILFFYIRRYILFNIFSFASSQTMDFVVKQYAVDGTYETIQPLQAVYTTLCCTGLWSPVQRNINLQHSCSLYPKAFNKADMHFYELYFIDRAVNQSRLINVPVRVLNFARGGTLRNKASYYMRDMYRMTHHLLRQFVFKRKTTFLAGNWSRDSLILT